MKRCKEREAELAAKQEVIRVNVVRFEKFIQDNDVKFQRARRKELDEREEGSRLRSELEALEQAEREENANLRDLQHTLAGLAKYEEYLEGVVEDSDYAEIADILFKFGTMRGTNADLRRAFRDRSGSLEGDRARLLHYVKAREDQVMVSGIETAELKKRLEALRLRNAKAEEVLEAAARAEADKAAELGAAQMAIANLFKRCKEVGRVTPRFSMSEVDLVLEYIQNKVTDLGFAVEVHEKGPEAAGLRMETFDKRKTVSLPGIKPRSRSGSAAGGGATRAGVGETSSPDEESEFHRGSSRGAPRSPLPHGIDDQSRSTSSVR